MLHGAGIFIYANICPCPKSPSFVGSYIPAPYIVRIIGIHHAAPGEVLYNDNALAARPFYSFLP